MAHKVLEIIQYTEWVYYDDSGDEVGRERNHDDSTYDRPLTSTLTDEERAEWLLT